jgi:hypothetical protein
MHIDDWIVLDHLDRLTDSTGLIQHAIYSIPRRDSGYTTDDNARALRLCVRLAGDKPDKRMLERIVCYLGFLEFARTGGGFHNFLGYDRSWLDVQGCGDCQGQAVRALAEVLGSRLPDDFRCLARELIESVLPALADLRSLRAQAYIVLAWGHLWRQGMPDIELLEQVAWQAARRLVENFQRCQRPEWHWFESRLTYANAVLPHALLVASCRWPQNDFLSSAQASMAFLDQATTVNGVFMPIGNRGWYPHGEEKAEFDQQPVEAGTMAEAALAAFEVWDDEQYLQIFRRAHGWFHGANSLGQAPADARCGSCCDGLHSDGINRNQGAESTLAFLHTELLHKEFQQKLLGIPSTTSAIA